MKRLSLWLIVPAALAMLGGEGHAQAPAPEKPSLQQMVDTSVADAVTIATNLRSLIYQQARQISELQAQVARMKAEAEKAPAPAQ